MRLINRFVISIWVFLLPLMGLAQTATHKNGFGINQDFHDYNVRLLDNKITSFDSSLSQSLRISWNRYLGRSWALSVGVTNGFLLNQTEENKLIRKSHLFGGDIDLMLTLNNGRFFPVDSRIAPYLSFGYNFNYLDAYKDLGITPMVISNEYGFGTYIKLGSKSKLQVGAALNQQLNGDFDTHMQYRLGFAQTIGKETKKPVVPIEDIDYDKDGIADANDKCPTLPGVPTNAGCPEEWSDGGLVLNDSVLALIDDLEQSILKLKSDIYNLSNNQVVDVVCQPGTGEIVQATKKETKQTPDVDPSKKDEVVAKNDSENKIDGDKPTTKKKESKPIAQADTKPKTTKTTTSKSVPTSPMVKYKTDGDAKSYYVIAISTKDQALAERSAALIANDFQIVKVLPQPNGFYRVGIYATKTKEEALKILDYAKNHGIPSGWIAYE